MNLQFTYKLSTFYILKTTNGYNAFCLDKLTINELLVIYSHAKYVDNDFIKFCAERDFFTLRMNGNKELILTIESKHNDNIKSNAHKIFFNDIMKYNIKDNTSFDNETLLDIACFHSSKHGDILDV